MNIKNLAVFSCIFLLLLSSPIFAAEEKPYYISGNIGLSLVDATVSDPRIAFTVESELETDFMFGAAVGYDFGMGRIEGEIGYSMHDLEASGASVASGGDIDILSLLINGFYDIETKSPVTPYVGGGVGVAFIDIEDVSVSGIVIENKNDKVFAYQLGAGIGYAVTDSVTLDFGYRYFAASDPDFDGTEAEVSSHNFTVGARFSFQ